MKPLPDVCDGVDLLGTWTAPPFDLFEIRLGQNASAYANVSKSFTILGTEGCTFWGDDSGLALLGLIHSDLATASILEIGHWVPGGGVATSAVVDVHLSDGALKWHYVGTTSDGKAAGVFDAGFTKSENATAAPTPAASTPGSDGAAGRSVQLLVTLLAAAVAL